MTSRPNRPSVRSRATLAVGIASLAVVAVAARMPAAQQSTEQAKPAVAAAATADMQAVKPDSTKTDSLVIDTAVVMMASPTMTISAAPAAAPQHAAPTSWPVDPATGQTLINGIPVVGRVFIQQKVDGITKTPSVAEVMAQESMTPEAPIVQSSRGSLAPSQIRRQRTAMVQATLWALDGKRAAVRGRYYPTTTSAASLGQR